MAGEKWTPRMRHYVAVRLNRCQDEDGEDVEVCGKATDEEHANYHAAVVLQKALLDAGIDARAHAWFGWACPDCGQVLSSAPEPYCPMCHSGKTVA